MTPHGRARSHGPPSPQERSPLAFAGTLACAPARTHARTPCALPRALASVGRCGARWSGSRCRPCLIQGTERARAMGREGTSTGSETGTRRRGARARGGTPHPSPPVFSTFDGAHGGPVGLPSQNPAHAPRTVRRASVRKRSTTVVPHSVLPAAAHALAPSSRRLRPSALCARRPRAHRCMAVGRSGGHAHAVRRRSANPPR